MKGKKAPCARRLSREFAGLLQVFCRKNSGNRAPVSVYLCPSIVRRACGHVWRATHGTIASPPAHRMLPQAEFHDRCHTVAATARTTTHGMLIAAVEPQHGEEVICSIWCQDTFSNVASNLSFT